MKSIVIALAVLVLSAPAWAQDYEPTGALNTPYMLKHLREPHAAEAAVT